MTVLDTSCVVDLLLGDEAAAEVWELLRDDGGAAAPDLLVFETLAVLRRQVLHGNLDARRAAGAVDDLADVPLTLFPAMALRERAWELRSSIATADALFVALAEQLDEPLATKDRRLARSAKRHARVPVHAIGA